MTADNDSAQRYQPAPNEGRQGNWEWVGVVRLGVGDDGAGIALIVWIVCSAQAETHPPSAVCDICSASKGCNVIYDC